LICIILSFYQRKRSNTTLKNLFKGLELGWDILYIIWKIVPNGVGLGWVDLGVEIFYRSFWRPLQNLVLIGWSTSCIQGFGMIFRRIYKISQLQPINTRFWNGLQMDIKNISTQPQPQHLPQPIPIFDQIFSFNPPLIITSS
jgi:hypothetical protein